MTFTKELQGITLKTLWVTDWLAVNEHVLKRQNVLYQKAQLKCINFRFE